MGRLLHKVYEYIFDNDMIMPMDKIVIGVSGGADSVCLLLALCALRDRFGYTLDGLVVAHINHGLRGEASDGDEMFVKQLCDSLGVTFVSYSTDIKEYAQKQNIGLEEAGRKFRYECFDNVLDKYDCNKIAVAHNKNDMAETVIFNMIRGSGLRGLSGILPVRGKVIRPLLNVTRDEIEEYLSECNQVYRTDSSNNELEYDRNKIRHIILPEMMKINSGAIKHICQLADEAKNSYSYIRNEALDKYDGYTTDEEFGKTVTLDISKLYEYSPVLQEYVVQEAIGDVAGKLKDIGRKHVMSVVGLIYQDTGRSVELPYGISARKSYNNLIITNKPDTMIDFNIEIVGEDKAGNGNEMKYIIPNFGELAVKFIENEAGIEISKNTYTKMADYGKINGNLCIRTPLDGDYIVIDSNGSTKKLSRVFIDNKIDRNKRISWPVVAYGSEIIWAIGLRYSEAYKIDENTTKIIYMDYSGKGE